METELLEQYCKTEGLKGIYLIPDYQNPTTHTMSLEGRRAIAEVACALIQSPLCQEILFQRRVMTIERNK